MPDAPADLGALPFRRQRDAGDVLNATVRFLRDNLRELLRTYLVVVLPLALAAGLSATLWFSQMSDLMLNPEAFARAPEAMFGPGYFGTLLFSFVGSALTLAAGGGYVRLYREGLAGEITAGDVWDEAKGLIFPFLGLFFLFGLAASLSAVIAIVPCLGFLAWAALLVWMIPRVMVTVAVRTLDEPSLAASWRRAGALVKGSWGFAFGAILLAGVVFYAGIIVISLPLYVVGAVVGLGSTSDPTGTMTVMGILFTPLQVLSYAGTLLPLVATFFVHGRLVEELEGTSLHADLDALADEAGTRTSSAFDAPASAPPASTPPPSDDDAPSGDRPSGGFRGGGFGG